MRRRTFLRTASTVAAVTTATAAMPGSATAAEEGTTHTVEMTDGLAFEPDRLTVAPGDTVVWENVGNAGHSVTAYEEDIPEGADYWASGGFESEQTAREGYEFEAELDQTGNIAAGQSWSHTFETEGTHEYFCKPHEGGGMVGTVVVADDPGAVTPAPTDTPGKTETLGGTDTTTDSAGDGESAEVAVGPDDSFRFDPESLTVSPGTTVTFRWRSDNHNVVPESQPEGANWEGEGESGVFFDAGHTYSHTFDTEGTYDYVCTPHEAAGMVGSIEVNADAAPGGDDDGSLPIGVPGLIFGGLGIGVASFLSGMYYGGKRNGEGRDTAALAGVGVVALGIVLLLAVVASLLVTG